ncbi:MAG TPA: hypothetical protein VE954_36915 [Oligoflexus sp.]|uniref:hypothetical protein n=1 Tax=Oligoflexus sp. TaxID=1971216 RepID=UPI002D3019C5|nr:hypothetical protein [Oligoflexus sp.]HYX38720.1 hypothetical protein [Oligoflexus sp.]
MLAIELFKSYLIEVMAVTCLIALFLRVVAYRTNRSNQAYFNAFAFSVIRHVEEEEAKNEPVEDVDVWLENMLDSVKEHLPDRSLRFKNSIGSRSERLTEYTNGKLSVVMAMKQQSDALKSPYPPNFMEVADRVLDQDKKWRSILGFMPVDALNRGLDVLPNLFVIGGILGTFVGITISLPLIGAIDITKLAEAGPILNQFVAGVALSMNTSIAGIVFCVIMTLVTALFPLNASRDEVAKNFERAVEVMWYRIHGTKLSPAEQKITMALEKMTQEMSRLLTSISEELKKQNQDNNDSTPRLRKGA